MLPDSKMPVGLEWDGVMQHYICLWIEQMASGEKSDHSFCQHNCTAMIWWHRGSCPKADGILAVTRMGFQGFSNTRAGVVAPPPLHACT